MRVVPGIRGRGADARLSREDFFVVKIIGGFHHASLIALGFPERCSKVSGSLLVAS